METLKNLSDDTIQAIHDLIEINIDSYKGFEQAADSVDEQRFATLFKTCAAERRDHVRALRNHVPSYQPSGSVRGTVHRWWLDVRAKLQGGEAHAVMAEAERGEDAIKGRYEALLKDNPGSPLNAELQRQYVDVKKRHDQIRDLRDSLAQ